MVLMDQSPQILPWQRQTDETDHTEAKQAYARYIYGKPATPEARFHAARQLYPSQETVGFALTVASDWPDDPIVIAELDRLASEDEQDLPNKAKLARDIYNLADDGSKSVDDRLKAYKLYAEVRGFIEKPAPIGNVNNNYVDNRKVMLIPPSPPIDEWEQGAVNQQAKLVSDASS